MKPFSDSSIILIDFLRKIKAGVRKDEDGTAICEFEPENRGLIILGRILL